MLTLMLLLVLTHTGRQLATALTLRDSDLNCYQETGKVSEEVRFSILTYFFHHLLSELQSHCNYTIAYSNVTMSMEEGSTTHYVA